MKKIKYIATALLVITTLGLGAQLHNEKETNARLEKKAENQEILLARHYYSNTQLMKQVPLTFEMVSHERSQVSDKELVKQYNAIFEK